MFNLPPPRAGLKAATFGALQRARRLSAMDAATFKWVEGACREHCMRISKVRRRKVENGLPSARVLSDKLFQGQTARISALLRALFPSGSGGEGLKWLDELGALTVPDFEHMLAHMKANGPLEGEARLILKEKPPKHWDCVEGSYKPVFRSTLAPSFIIKAAHLIIEDVLDALQIFNPYEFNAPGRGSHAAVLQVQKHIDRGARCFLTFDIENFYPSLGPKHLAWLPLPSWVIKHWIFYNAHVHIIYKEEQKNEAKTARHNLPMGARLSSRISSVFLGRVIQALPGELWAATFSDDGLLSVRTLAEAKLCAEALSNRLMNNRAGPLLFKFLRTTPVGEPFSFLKYRINFQSESVVRFHPDEEAFNAFRSRIVHKMKFHPEWNGCSYEQTLALARFYVQKWMDSFTLWTPTEEVRQGVLSQADVVVSTKYADVQKLKGSNLLACE